MKRTLWMLALGAGLLAMVAGAAACGGDDEDDDDGGSPAVTRPAGAASPSGQATSAAPTEPAGDGELTVTATEFQFSPASLTIAGGEATVSFQNAGSAPHTFTVYADAAFAEPIAGADSGRVTGGGEAEVALQLAGAGERYFRCEVHPAQMQGTITVE